MMIGSGNVTMVMMVTMVARTMTGQTVVMEAVMMAMIGQADGTMSGAMTMLLPQ
jgi:hypothetical protein